MSTAHTPGPWVVNPIQLNQIATADARMEIARATVLNDQHETITNAKLMAAAPDLLEALSAFLRAPSVGSNGPGSSTIVVQDFNLRAARDAIAKATGGAV